VAGFLVLAFVIHVSWNLVLPGIFGLAKLQFKQALGLTGLLYVIRFALQHRYHGRYGQRRHDARVLAHHGPRESRLRVACTLSFGWFVSPQIPVRSDGADLSRLPAALVFDTDSSSIRHGAVTLRCYGQDLLIKNRRHMLRTSGVVWMLMAATMTQARPDGRQKA
jgi:hypothetical protein